MLSDVSKGSDLVSVSASDSSAPLLSVIIPVYNEAQTVSLLIDRVLAVPIDKEIIVVDDGSTDESPRLLAELNSTGTVRAFAHPVNRGKGAAIRTALREARGRLIIIQDADLEYDPSEFEALLVPLTHGNGATVVYGSRFLGEAHHMSRWHWFGNHFVTAVFNVLYGTSLTDMETCYKVINRDALAGITLESNRWGIDPEITAKLVRAGHKIIEVPVHYSGRDSGEGKKLRWKDGFSVLIAIVRYRFS